MQVAASSFGMSMSAFAATRKNRLDMSVGIAVGSVAQIALFVAPVLVFLSLVVAGAKDLELWRRTGRDRAADDVGGVGRAA